MAIYAGGWAVSEAVRGAQGRDDVLLEEQGTAGPISGFGSRIAGGVG